MHSLLRRRRFLQTVGMCGLATALGARPWGSLRPATASTSPKGSTGELAGRVYKSIKFGMFAEEISVPEKFRLLKEMGFDGVELSSPVGENLPEMVAASRRYDLPIHGVVDGIHWSTRLSDPSVEVREKGLQGLLTAIRDAHSLGGTAVLLVPGAVNADKNETHDDVWERSIVQIRRALPLASRLGVHILIENVWNGFLYEPDGPDNQTADQLADYIDEIASPWVGVYFDIGNHQKYGKPAEWIRTLGPRIVKLDVKEWGKENGFSKIGDGDVDWPAVRKALVDIRFTGWSTAEVSGGDRNRMREIAERMDRVLGL